jgi:hypothetical protein
MTAIGRSSATILAFWQPAAHAADRPFWATRCSQEPQHARQEAAVVKAKEKTNPNTIVGNRRPPVRPPASRRTAAPTAQVFRFRRA